MNYFQSKKDKNNEKKFFGKYLYNRKDLVIEEFLWKKNIAR